MSKEVTTKTNRSRETVTLEVVSASKPAPLLSGGDDAATAKQFGKLFAEAQNGMRRIVALGLFAWELKERKLKHGQFGLWLAAHCPNLTTIDTATGKPKPSRALQGYMELTKGVLESIGFSTVAKYLDHISNAQACAFELCQRGQFLLLPEKKVTEVEPKALRAKVCALVDGKTKRALVAEFKQQEDGKAKRGRLKGEGGASKEQRASAKQRAREAEVLEIKLTIKDTAKQCDELANDKMAGDPEVRTEAKDTLLPSVENLFHYLKRLK